MTQFFLDFDSKLPPSAQAGMAQADENANEKWKTIIDGCILAAARRLQELTVDDVLEEYEKLPKQVRPTTHALDALGPAMVRARQKGILRSTGKTKRSQRPEKHGIRHSVWESRYWAPF